MSYVCVVGGANVDILCLPAAKIQLRDSNPGKLRVSPGGVGRNIAENLARLGVDVKLLTVLGNDGNATLIRNNARQTGIDLSHAITADMPSSTYISLNDVDGDMFVGFSAMDSIDLLTTDYIAANLALLNGAAAVVLDTNLTDGLQYMCDNITAPKFMDAVSCAKAMRAKPYLRNLHCLKVNHEEATALTGVEVVDERSARQCFAKLDCTETLYVSCGAKGVYCVDESGATFVPGVKTTAVNASGAGDSFFAGTVFGFVQGYDLVRAAKIGCACGALTVASTETVCPTLDRTAVEKLFTDK